MRKKTDQKRAHITAAAKHEFLRQSSYSAVSMDAIAEQANVSKQTLYSYFKTKEELFLTVVKDLIGEPWAHELAPSQLDTIQNRQDFSKLLHQILTTIAAKLMQPEYLALMRIVLAETQNQPELANHYREQFPEKAIAAVSALMLSAKEKKFISMDPHVAVRMLVGSVLTYVLLQGMLAVQKPRQPTVKEIQTIIDEFMLFSKK